jgi:signal transduction histidine kinase
VTPLRPPRLAAALLVFTVAALAAGAGFGIAAHSLAAALQFAPVLLAFAVVGWLIASRRPRNPIGWLYLAEALAFSVAAATKNYARYATAANPHLPGAVWLNWGGAIAGNLFFVFALVLLFFPDGSLPSRRWRPVAGLIITAEAVLMVNSALSGAALSSQGSAIVSPVNVISLGSANAIQQFVQTVLIPITIVAASGCVMRYRRSSADARHQIKWFAYAGLLTSACMLIFGVGVNNPLIGFNAVGPLVPIATGIAIMKYRLYDIDVVIRRTIVYAAMAAFITAVYIAIVVGIGSLSSGTLAASGSRPSLALSILATTVVAIAFQPVRARVQRLASRLVYGRRATPYQALSEFTGQMGESIAYDEVLPRMARILAEGTGADRAHVWLAADSALQIGASWPASGVAPEPVQLPLDDEPPVVSSADRVVLVQHGGEVLGALSVCKRAGEVLTPTEDKLLSDLASQAGLILRNVGLTEQLQARLDELLASRRRIVGAEDAERQRIQRDLQEGTERQLIDIAATIAAAQGLAGQNEARDRETVAELRSQTKAALAKLRELAHGINPPLLADSGLAAAASALVSRAAAAAELTTGVLGRYPAEVETAVYFCCVETLQNATKHAPGATVRLVLSEQDGTLTFSATDDGPGFDLSAVRHGAGLQNMTDRIAALGGTLDVVASPGAGTTVTGRIGVASAAEAPEAAATSSVPVLA